MQVVHRALFANGILEHEVSPEPCPRSKSGQGTPALRLEGDNSVAVPARQQGAVSWSTRSENRKRPKGTLASSNCIVLFRQPCVSGKSAAAAVCGRQLKRTDYATTKILRDRPQPTPAPIRPLAPVPIWDYSTSRNPLDIRRCLGPHSRCCHRLWHQCRHADSGDDGKLSAHGRQLTRAFLRQQALQLQFITQRIQEEERHPLATLNSMPARPSGQIQPGPARQSSTPVAGRCASHRSRPGVSFCALPSSPASAAFTNTRRKHRSSKANVSSTPKSSTLCMAASSFN